MATFADLPFEIHRQIFRELAGDYGPRNEKIELLKLPRRTRKDLLTYSSINKTWRTILREITFNRVSMRPHELNDFVDMVGGDESLMTFVERIMIDDVTGKYPSDRIASRASHFFSTWATLGSLTAVATLKDDTFPGLKLNLTEKDPKLRKWYEVGKNQPYLYSMVPRKPDKQKLKEQIDCFREPVSLWYLNVWSKISDHLELHPEVLKTVIRCNPGIRAFGLDMCDIRHYRTFRKEIYDGLVRILEKISESCERVNWLHISYNSSYSEDDIRKGKAFSLVESEHGDDPLSTLIRTLSYRVRDLCYQGRISHHLFSPLPDINDSHAWYRIEAFEICFEAVDAFGEFVLSREIPEHGQLFVCLQCRRAREAVDNKEFGYLADPLLCKDCRLPPLESVIPNLDKIDGLFKAASKAMLRMEKIKTWKFRSTDRFVYFYFQRSENKVTIDKYWEPYTESFEIWEERWVNIKLEGPEEEQDKKDDDGS